MTAPALDQPRGHKADLAPHDHREGHGLDSLRARLVSVFAEDAELGIAGAAGGAVVTISLPRKRALL